MQSGPQGADRLMMVAVDRQGFPKQRTQAPALRCHHGMDGGIMHMGRTQMAEQGPAEKHVNHLNPAADAKYRFLSLTELLQQLPFPFIALLVHAGIQSSQMLSIVRRMDISAAG